MNPEANNNNTINYRKYYWIIALGVLAIGFIVGWSLEFYNNKGELTALIDVTLTTIALFIAILEILMVRNIAESSKQAVDNALNRIREIISVSDIAKGAKIAQDIQKYLRSSEFHFAHLRLQDLKFIIIPLRHDSRFDSLESYKKLPKVLSSLGFDINNIASLLNGNKDKLIDIDKVNINLEELISILIEFENHIKSN